MRSSRVALALAFCVCVVPAASDAATSAVGSDCRAKGHQLWGRVQVVEHFADLDVKVVEHFADVKVTWVDHFPDACGRWQRVEHFPDVKIRLVEHFPDVEVKYVNHFPGLP